MEIYSTTLLLQLQPPRLAQVLHQVEQREAIEDHVPLAEHLSLQGRLLMVFGVARWTREGSFVQVEGWQEEQLEKLAAKVSLRLSWPAWEQESVAVPIRSGQQTKFHSCTQRARLGQEGERSPDEERRRHD